MRLAQVLVNRAGSRRGSYVKLPGGKSKYPENGMLSQCCLWFGRRMNFLGISGRSAAQPISCLQLTVRFLLSRWIPHFRTNWIWNIVGQFQLKSTSWSDPHNIFRGETPWSNLLKVFVSQAHSLAGPDAVWTDVVPVFLEPTPSAVRWILGPCETDRWFHSHFFWHPAKWDDVFFVPIKFWVMGLPLQWSNMATNKHPLIVEFPPFFWGLPHNILCPSQKLGIFRKIQGVRREQLGAHGDPYSRVPCWMVRKRNYQPHVHSCAMVKWSKYGF